VACVHSKIRANLECAHVSHNIGGSRTQQAWLLTNVNTPGDRQVTNDPASGKTLGSGVELAPSHTQARGLVDVRIKEGCCRSKIELSHKAVAAAAGRRLRCQHQHQPAKPTPTKQRTHLRIGLRTCGSSGGGASATLLPSRCWWHLPSRTNAFSLFPRRCCQRRRRRSLSPVGRFPLPVLSPGRRAPAPAFLRTAASTAGRWEGSAAVLAGQPRRGGSAGDPPSREGGSPVDELVPGAVGDR